MVRLDRDGNRGLHSHEVRKNRILAFRILVPWFVDPLTIWGYEWTACTPYPQPIGNYQQVRASRPLEKHQRRMLCRLWAAYETIAAIDHTR
jgi:hypothetical protein